MVDEKDKGWFPFLLTLQIFIKNIRELEFKARNLDKSLDRVFSGTKYRQEAEQCEKRGDRTYDIFLTGQSAEARTCPA
jgi:hypothetical protein